MDHLAKAYIAVRDATVENTNISKAEKIALLEVIKMELVTQAQADIHAEAMKA